MIEAKDPAPSPQDLKKGIPQGPILRPCCMWIRINTEIVEQFEGRPISYYRKDSVVTDGVETPYNDINDEVLNSLNPCGLPAHSITLKIGCPVMIIRNINDAKGLCNGTRMIVTELRSNYVVVKHLNGSESFAILRIPLVAKD